MRPDLPSGTVTFLFTDVDGSTRLLHELGAEGYADALAEHRRVIRKACERQGGVEVDTQGDAFFFAFPTATGALAAASSFNEALAPGPIQVRVGLHTGTPLVTDEGYVGDDVHLAARIAASAHGAQVVLSRTTRELCGSEPQGMTLVDLGEHRLKDIAEPVAIYQLGDGTFPPLTTISNTNLPRPASSFLGRERELAEVLERIRGGARLVTLTGPGGTGKTRLAIEAAGTLLPEHRAGVFWVGLAALRDQALVLETIAQTLGAKDSLAEHVAERELLLLLDNLEQVIGVAPDLASLLERCPNLTLLVTSRELLRVRGEVEYPVPPLAPLDAVRLFCGRSALEPSEEIAELCARLDSLPLAVELAAARTRALTVSQILERLSQRLDLLQGGRDADPRQQTLRATIEWSYDLLSEEEQRLFSALSIFAGGCTLEAAEQVCDADLDTLHSLVEKSLLRFTEGRYWMLETVREYAGNRLKGAGEYDAMLLRLSEWVLALARSADAPVSSELRLADLRSVRDWARALSHAALWELPALVWGLLLTHNVSEAQAWLEEALDACGGAPTRTREQLLAGASWCAFGRGELHIARRRGEERLEVSRALGDEVATARSLGMLGSLAAELGDSADALAYSTEAVEILRACDATSESLAGALHNLGVVHERGEQAQAARARFEEALVIWRSAADDDHVAGELVSIGATFLQEGNLGAAHASIVDGLSIVSARRAGTGYVDVALLMLSVIAKSRDDPRVAAKLLGAADAAVEARGVVFESQHRERHRTVTQWVGEHLSHASFKSLTDEGARMSLDEAVEYALASLD